MKKLIVLTMVLAVISGCSKPKENPKYSCDPVLEKFASDWLSSNSSGITRSQLIEFGFDSQRAIYGGLTAQNKLDLWKDKISHLEGLSYFDSSQVAAFEALNNIMVIEGFDEDSTNNTTFESDFVSWYTSYRILFDTSEYRHGIWKLDDFSTSLNGVPNIGVVEGCKCSTQSDWCGTFGGGSSCQTGGCTIEGRCGTFWRDRCNGLCEMGTSIINISNYNI